MSPIRGMRLCYAISIRYPTESLNQPGVENSTQWSLYMNKT